MTYPVFYVPAGDVVPIFFDTYDGGTGASITMTGLAVTDIEIFKDGSVTQRASDAGYVLLDTDGIDFDGLTGIHGFSIDTGDNTDAGFYTVGAWFTVVVSAITVDAQTVSFIAAQFRLMPAEAIAGKPKVDVDAWGGGAVPAQSVTGVPEVDLTHIAGTLRSVTAAQLGVNVVQADQTPWNAGAFTAATFGTGAITATTLAPDTLGSDEVAAGAVTKIAAGVWNALRASFQAIGSFGQGNQASFIGAVASATASTLVLGTQSVGSAASAVNDQYNQMVVCVIAGLGEGQQRGIVDYDGTTKTITPDGDWTTTPDSTSKVVIIGV